MKRLLSDHALRVAQLETGFNNLSQGVVIFDKKSQVVFCNGPYRDIYGLSTEQTKPGTPLDALLKHRLQMTATVKPADKNLPPTEQPTTIFELHDGRIISFAMRPIAGGGGISTHEDITQREAITHQLNEQYQIVTKQQKQLQMRNLQFDTAINNMSEALCFFDKDERLVVCNDNYAKLWNIHPDAIRPGITLQEVIELRKQAGYIPAVNADGFYAWRSAVADAAEVCDAIIEHTNGRVFVFHHRPMPGGGWVSTQRDITEREELYRKLQEQIKIVEEQQQQLQIRNMQFDIALNNMSQGLCFFDGMQRLIVCNNRYLDMYGLKRDAVIPGITTLAEIIELRHAAGSFPDMSMQDYHDWRNNVAEKDSFSDTVVKLKNGRMISICHQPMPDKGWVATHEDITRQCKTEDDLKQAVEALKASNKAKSAFLANMSHEIRTPLNGVLGMAQVLNNDDLTPRQRENVHTILESGHALMALLNDVLDLTKIEAGKLEIALADESLKCIFTHLRKLFLPRAEEKLITLRLNLDASIPDMLRFDGIRVRQCASNLISNSIKFTETGSVEINVSHEVLAPDQYLLRVSVTDTGIGISDETARRLFSAFEQADASTTRRFGGSGLGLAITKQLARLMGGDVSVVSEVGKGSTFTFTFRASAPLGRKNSVQLRSGDGLAKHSGTLSGLRILLVDDNAINRNVARLLLLPTAAAITEAVNGKHCLELLQELQFDIVLLDVHMPVMDGKETIGHIRQSDMAFREIPVIALTADAMGGDKEELMSHGMSGYVSKPIEQNSLIREICRVLDIPLTAAEADDEAVHMAGKIAGQR